MTQFEPTDARRCFPCWDEPSLKATFGMILTVPEDRYGLGAFPNPDTVYGPYVTTRPSLKGSILHASQVHCLPIHLTVHPHARLKTDTFLLLYRVALSNMPEASVTKKESSKTVVFETTPVMSTYLLAFCVGEFDFIEATTPEGVIVRCWTPVGKSEQGRFALDTAVGSLSFFGEYFDSPYPLPKMVSISQSPHSAD
mgnify:FL=1